MSDFPSDYAPDPALDFTGLGGVEGDAAGLQPRQEDEEGAAEEMAEGLGVSWMEAFGAEMDWAARARVQTPRSQWTGRDYSDLGVAEAFAEEMAEQAAEAAAEAEAAQAVTEAVEAEEEVREVAAGEAFLRERVLGMLLGRAGCPRELRLQLARGVWPLCLHPQWWDVAAGAGFFEMNRDPALGGTWEDYGDGLCWVDPWGCASVREEEMGGVIRPVWCFRPWREARGLEVVAEEVGPRARCRGTRGRAGGVRAGPAAA